MPQRPTIQWDEKSVLRRCQAGDHREYNRIVIRYRTRIVGLARQYLNDLDEAEDLSQEVFLQGLLKIHRYDISRDFKTWLTTITVRRSIDALRRRRLFVNYLENERARAACDALHAFEGGGASRRIRDSELFAPLLAHLSGRQRDSLLLHLDEGYSTAEIAARFNCTSSTVRGYLFSARRILRRQLEKLEGDQARLLRVSMENLGLPNVG